MMTDIRISERERSDVFRANPMVQGFLSVMLQDMQYTENDEACEAKREPRDTGTIYDCPDSTFRAVVAECEAFAARLPRDGSGRTLLDLACDYGPEGYDLERAGADLYLERAGHGAGFFDRGLGEVGDRLSAMIDSGLETYLGDDGEPYIFGKERA